MSPERAAMEVIHRDHVAHLARLRAAMEATAASEQLEERRLEDGLLWVALGPRGRQWCIAWQPGPHGDLVRAWPLDTGSVSQVYRGAASGEDEARAEARRMAGEIRRGPSAALEAREAATAAETEG